VSQYFKGATVWATIKPPGEAPYRNPMGIYFQPETPTSEAAFLLVGKNEGDPTLAGYLLQIPAKALLSSQTGVPVDKVTV
jgi:hypothetical protein